MGGAGRRRAGSALDPPRKLTDAQKKEARLRRAEGATLKELAQTYDVGLTTIFRISKIVQPMRESSEDYSNSTVFKATNADHSLAD
jgi:hypothetical protein